MPLVSPRPAARKLYVLLACVGRHVVPEPSYMPASAGNGGACVCSALYECWEAMQLQHAVPAKRAVKVRERRVPDARRLTQSACTPVTWRPRTSGRSTREQAAAGRAEHLAERVALLLRHHRQAVRGAVPAHGRTLTSCRRRRGGMFHPYMSQQTWRACAAAWLCRSMVYPCTPHHSGSVIIRTNTRTIEVRMKRSLMLSAAASGTAHACGTLHAMHVGAGACATGAVTARCALDFEQGELHGGARVVDAVVAAGLDLAVQEFLRQLAQRAAVRRALRYAAAC